MENNTAGKKSSSSPSPNNKRGGRRRSTGLRRHQPVDGVVVEETFPLYHHPSSTNDNSEALSGSSSKEPNVEESSSSVGEGVYVSATPSKSNKRYYGLLIDQSALRVASTLYFQDQNDSLLLNERMKVLLLQKQLHSQQQRIEEGGGKNPHGTTSRNNDNHRDDEINHAKTNSAVIKRPLEEETYLDASNDDTTTTATTTLIESSKRPRYLGEDDEMTVGPLMATSSSPSLSSPSEQQEQSKNSRQRPAAIRNPMMNQQLKREMEERPVQKFKYVRGKSDVNEKRNKKTAAESGGYRILVATFCNIYEAACGDPIKAYAIHSACEKGGNFLSLESDSYYYQYEVLPSSLSVVHDDYNTSQLAATMRTSMGFNSFLHDTLLPPWYPLSNLHSQSKVLTMLNMKRDNKGNVKWEGTQHDALVDAVVSCSGGGLAGGDDDVIVTMLEGGTRLPIRPRVKRQYQIGVIGGGIAGLACCQELITMLTNDGIDARVTLMEARSRFGGRLLTDRSWKTDNNKKEFPTELGASWIHGIDDNPLAALARSAGAEFVTASEEVKMLDKGMKEVDSEVDERMGKLFDDLLDHAAEDCWTADEQNSHVVLSPEPNKIGRIDPQAAVRWYASGFSHGVTLVDDANKESTMKFKMPVSVGPPSHRISSDRSVDCEIGKAIAKHRLREFAKLTDSEHRMLLWNIKNVEYAIGANLNMMSTKYWDADDRHAFEGDHVLLREGYSTVVNHMLQNLKAAGFERFEYFLDFPVGKVEYGRKSATQPFGRDRFGRERQLSELSDTCSVTSEDGSETKYFDFLVCAVPLGVLKESIERAKDVNVKKKITFLPSLPFSKVDAISNVGFGLLNKVYVRFPMPFWRIPGFFKDENDCLFGNVSGVNPHHYMFFDVGRRLGSKEDAPAILMSLVSGKEAVALECLSDSEVVEEVMETLRALFSEQMPVPDPVSFRITRWGKDRFSRGSYTFLPPGSTDQDFQLLQSPVNANGDSLLLEGAEVMRLFFAGEHTTALYPSMAHGALLSGMRAAQEVVATIQCKNSDDKDTDKVIPVALFRYQNPTTPLRCNLCHKIGGQVREGSLLAFKRGARQVLVHNNCAEFSPEVEVVDSKWKNVIRAVNRGKTFFCTQCSLSGATVGCSAESCFLMYHFSCAEDCGWRFDRDGKQFFCDLHRKVATWKNECDRISIQYFSEKNKRQALICSLCRLPEDYVSGKLLAFQCGRKQLCVHLNCVKYTSIVDTSEVQESRMGHEFHNVFEAVENARTCSSCGKTGATIGCTKPNCNQVLHYSCAVGSAWNFQKNGKHFCCSSHRNKHTRMTNVERHMAEDPSRNGGLMFQHNLFAQLGATRKDPKVDIPGNLDIGGTVLPNPNKASPDKSKNNDDYSDSDESFPGEDEQGIEVLDIPLSQDISGPKQLVRLERASRDELWNLSLQFQKVDNFSVVMVAAVPTAANDVFSLKEKDILVSINGSKIGCDGLKTLRDILFRLKQEVDLLVQVIRKE